jgi:hypothetical protein
VDPGESGSTNRLTHREVRVCAKGNRSTCVRIKTDRRTPTLVNLFHSQECGSSQSEGRPRYSSAIARGIGGADGVRSCTSVVKSKNLREWKSSAHKLELNSIASVAMSSRKHDEKKS